MTEMYKVAEDDKLKILESELVNTGGNCMVLVASYYDETNKRTLFISTSDECTNISIVDLIRNDIDSDLWDEMIIDSAVNSCKADWYESEYAYYIDKQILEYDLQCAKRFKNNIICYPIDNAPTEVLNKAEAVGPKYLQWLDDNGLNISVDVNSGLIDVNMNYTNWLMNNTYPMAKSSNRIADEIQQFKEYLESDYPQDILGENDQEYNERFTDWTENRMFTLSFGTRSVCIPNVAEAYDAAVTFCNRIVKEFQ